MTGGERAFLDWLARLKDVGSGLITGIGDDAAVIRSDPDRDLVVCADAIAEGTHFVPGEDPALIGRKALAVNLSDMAAMAAVPRFVFATATLRHGFALETATRMATGMRSLAAEFGCVLAGGDTTTHDGGTVLSVTVVGDVERGRAVERCGAQIGDVIAVTGRLGGSLASRRHLTFTPRVREARLMAATARLHAMIDISDGLLMDLDRLCARSRVGARIDAAAIPVHSDATLDQALGDGEDFELLFTVDPREYALLGAVLAPEVQVTAIGTIVDGGITIVRDGFERPAEPRGYEHR